MLKSTLAIISTFLLLAGCGRQQGSPAPDLGGPSGILTWSASGQKEKPIPGIDYASVVYEGTTLVVWSDFGFGASGSSSANMHGVKGQGRLFGRENRQIEFHFETKNGKSGPVTINQVKYELADGGLFLVSAPGDTIEVKQLKRDMRNRKFDRESLGAFARNDPEIVAFFGRSAKRE